LLAAVAVVVLLLADAADLLLLHAMVKYCLVE